MHRRVALYVLALVGAACAPRGDMPTSPSANSAGESELSESRSARDSEADSNDSPPSVAMEAPSGSGGYEELEVPGFLPSVLFVPAGGGRRPVVVAAHGAGGLPEWECDYWRRLTGGRAILLCLRGARTSLAEPSGFYYPNHRVLDREFQAALAALKQHPKAKIASGLYAGFSQGAIMGAPMIVSHAREFPRLVLIEGGYEYWSLATARAFAANGGKRVLFVCGTKWCKDKAEIPARWLAQVKVETRIEYAEGAGHTPGGAVMTRTAAALPWVLEGDSSWTE